MSGHPNLTSAQQSRLPRRPSSKEELHHRNGQLIGAMRQKLGNDPARFNEFKRCSMQFQQGVIPPEVYYQSFVQLFGRDSTSHMLFAELVALLPDMNKQQQLAQFV